MVGTAMTVRGWAITVWLALLGIAVERSSEELAVLALVALVPFAFVDAYHSWLYGEAFRHALSLERITAAYYGALERGEDDEDAVGDFEVVLGAHRPGLYTGLKRFGLTSVRDSRPRIVFVGLYPALGLAALATAVLL